MNVARRSASRNSTNPCITIVEADVALSLALSLNLKNEGYVVKSVDRGDEAVRKLADAPPDLVILDWMLPRISGLEICIRLRAEEPTRMLPIIMLSARGEEFLRLRGFSAGADDFVVLPFSMRELVARVRALLRRSRFAIPGSLLTRGDLQLDHQTRRVRRGSRDVHLRPTEFRLLECLLERLERLFSGAPFGARLGAVRRDHRSYCRCPHRTSRKALSTGREPDPILSVRGAGYSFDETFGNS